MSCIIDDPENILAEFSRRLWDEWLPAFCFDPAREVYSIEGFKPESIKVMSQDARDFMRALDSRIVVDAGGGEGTKLLKAKRLNKYFGLGRKVLYRNP